MTLALPLRWRRWRCRRKSAEIGTARGIAGQGVRGSLEVAVYTVITGYRIVTNARGAFLEVAVKSGDRVRDGTVLARVLDVY